MKENTKEEGRHRRLRGVMGVIQKVLLIAIPTIGILNALGLPIYLKILFFRPQYLALFLGLILASIFLGTPSSRSASRDRLPWYDLVMAGISLGIGLFTFFVYPGYVMIGIVDAGPEYVVLGILNILLLLEAVRRMTGWVLVVLGGIFLFYAHFTRLFPAPFYGKGIPLDELSIYLFVDSNGILGVPVWVAGGIIFGFILLGASLRATGSSQLLNDFAMSTFGRYRGGPAKMAVIASSLFGTISGSAVSNVAATGVITIPLMKRTGYQPAVAGAIEAAASTGGNLTPPVMGITSFLIAEFLAIPYSTVALAAVVPAVLYYFTLFLQVDLEAAKCGLKGLTGELPRLMPILKRCWVLIIPMIVLIYTLFILNWEPGLSAVAATATVWVLSFFAKETRLGFRKFLEVLEGTGRGLLMIGAVSSLAGVVIGVVYLTGVATIFSFILIKIGGQNLFFMLLITAIISMILGMGMPGSAIYIILAVLIAPSLVEMGVLTLSSHLFILYFGLMSLLTPPVCFAVYAGAAIAESNVTKTGFQAVRFAIAAYIVPFIFVYSPALILEGTAQEILVTVTKSLIGLGLLGIALSRFLFRRLDWSRSLLLGIGAFAILIPPGMKIPILTWILNLGGFILCVLIIFLEMYKELKLKSLEVKPFEAG